MNSKVTQIQPQRDLREELQSVLDTDSTLTQEAAAKQIGTSGTTVSRYLRGSYGGDMPELERRVSNWLHTYRARKAEARALPRAPAWVETPTSAEILATLEYAQIASDVVVIYGGAGVGKTESIRRYEETRPNVFVATATPAGAGVAPCLEEVAEAVGVATTVGGSAARLHRAIVGKLRNSYGLLVIDEAQHLSVAALDQARSIHDATGVGLALVGNEQVYAGMTGGNRAPYLDRLYSRIGKRLRLGKVGPKDVDAVIAAWEIDATPCKKLLRDIAHRPGGLRALTKVLRLASMYAVGEDRAVACEDVRAAWRELGGAA